jgi:hypothetical protein
MEKVVVRGKRGDQGRQQRVTLIKTRYVTRS